MEKQIIQIENVTASELFERLDNLTKLVSELKAKEPETTPKSDYLTRQEVADIFGITLATVHQWTIAGILSAYKVANRVYYKRKEVESTYTKTVSRKNVNR